MIKKRTALNDLFSSTVGVHEVYSDKDFNFSQDFASLYIVLDDIDTYSGLVMQFNSPRFLDRLHKIYDPRATFYLAHSSFDIMLENKKLIWKKGVWFDDILPEMRRDWDRHKWQPL